MGQGAPDHQRRLVGDEDMREIAVGAHRHDLVGLGEQRALGRAQRDHAAARGCRLLATGELALDTRQRFGQPLGRHGLQQIVDRVHGEGLDRMLGIGRDEHHDRRLVQRRQQVEAVAAAQLDVEEDHLRPGALDLLQGLRHALRFADDLDIGMRRQQPAHGLARQMLVVDDQDPEHGSPSSVSLATTLSPLSPSVKAWRPG